MVAWTADAADGKSKYVAVFNIMDTPKSIKLPWGAVGLSTENAQVRDLWAGKSLGRLKGIEMPLRAHASVLYKVAAE